MRHWLASRRADADRRVIAALWDADRYGYDLWKVTGLRAARLYSALRRLERDEVVTGRLLYQGEERPPRKLYRLR